MARLLGVLVSATVWATAALAFLNTGDLVTEEGAERPSRRTKHKNVTEDGTGRPTRRTRHRNVTKHGTERPTRRTRRKNKLMAQEAKDGSQKFYSQKCSVFPGKRVVLVTVNLEYLDMFQNWFHHAGPFLTETEQLVTIAEDQEAGIALRNLSTTLTPRFVVVDEFNGEHQTNVNLHLLHHGAKWMKYDNAAQPPFGSDGFFAVVHHRPKRILSFLNEGCSVLYNDIDTVWVKNPFIDIANGGIRDLYITEDSRYPNYPEFAMCTCFLYVNPKPATLTLLQKWSDVMDMPGAGGQDQGYFNNVLQEDHDTNKTVDYAVLPYEHFPPGLVVDQYNNISILHANWMMGHDTKKNFIKDRGFWNLPN